MKTKNLLLALSLTSLTCFGQIPGGAVPNIDYETTLSSADGTPVESFPSVLDVTGNFVYVAGYSFNNSTQRDYFLIKYDAATGAVIWQQTYDFVSLIDRARAVTVDNLGNVYVTGESQDIFTGYDLTTLKYDQNGNLLWSKRYNGTASMDDKGTSIDIDNSGNVYVCGFATNTGTGKDFTVIKYNSAGVQQFVYTKNGTAMNSNDVANKLVWNTNRLYVTGNVTNLVSNQDIFVTRLNAMNGNVDWSQTLNGTASGPDQSLDLKLYGNDLLICGGITNTGTGQDYFFSKFNSANGNVSFTKIYNGFGANDFATSLVSDAANNYAVTGLAQNGSNYDYHTVYFLTNGNQTWINKHITNSSVTSVFPKITRDVIANHFYVSGVKQNATLDGGLYQITPTGNETWSDYHDCVSGLDNAYVDMAIDNMARIYIAGVNEIAPNVLSISMIRYSQTPVYFPPDFLSQPSSRSHLYLKNQGQLRKTDSTLANEVLFYCPNSNPELYVEKNAFNFVFNKSDTSLIVLDTLERIQCEFLGSNPLAKYYQMNPKGHFYNFFLSDASSPSITDLRANERLFVPNFYPGIDLHYFSNKDGVKYYFVVKPSKEELIVPDLKINGAISTFTTNTNGLFIDGYLGDVEFNQPIAYQVNIANNIVPLGPATWQNTGFNTYNVNLPNYNPSLPLVILVSKKATIAAAAAASGNLEYSTYYGNINNDIFNDIKVAPNGDRYVVGNTDGANFPAVVSLFPYKGDLDAVFLKYSVIKDSLVFASFYGGASREDGNSIDINAAGEIFIGGRTFSYGAGSIPTLSLTGASNQTQNGTVGNPGLGFLADGFLAHFATNGNGLFWARYYGGSRDDGINSISVDAAGNFYYTGFAFSTDIPMFNAAQPSVNTWQTTNNAEAIVGKFNPAHALVFSTYFGNTSSPFSVTQEVGMDITTDGSGNAVAVGWTDCTNLPVNNSTGNPNVNTFFKSNLGGARDGFIVRYSPTGVKQFASYFGGSGLNRIDEISRVNYNSTKDEIYFAGRTNDTTSFPYVNLGGAFNLKNPVNLNNTGEGFIASMSSNFTKQWCTNYGKTAVCNFSITGLTSDNAGIIYLAGQAKSNTLNYPVNTPTLTVYNDTIRNADDGFIAVFSPYKDLFHAHYLGGTGNDYINNANVGANNKLYVVGSTGSSDYPIAYNNINIPFIDSTFGGGQYDGFITRFDMNTIQVISVKEINNAESFLNVYPNPAVNGFVLQLKDKEVKNTSVKIYSIMGQMISEKQITEQQTSFSCESWANGVYLINVNLNGNLNTFKLIKN